LDLDPPSYSLLLFRNCSKLPETLGVTSTYKCYQLQIEPLDLD